jgi:hypothetical protein
MRRAIILLSSFPLFAFVSGCTVESKTLYADARWRAWCPNPPFQGCNALPAHDFQQFDGDVVDGMLYRTSCLAIDDDGQLSVSLRVQEQNSSLEIRGLVTGSDGGAVVGAGCEVRLDENENVYSGSCGPDSPSEAQPCQIVSVAVDRSDADGPSVAVRLRCDSLPFGANPNQAFNVRDTANIDSPAEIRVANCVGL